MIFYYFLILSFLFTAAGFFSQQGWLFDLASHFRLQYAVLQLIFLPLCILHRRWKILRVTILALAFNLTVIVPLYFHPSFGDSGNIRLSRPTKILLINLFTGNRNYSRVTAYIEFVDPDILALEELNGIWLNELSPTLKKYPYRKFILRNDNFGIGIFSKFPADEIQEMALGTVKIPGLTASFTREGQPFSVVLAHLMPPGTLKGYHLRNSQLARLILERGKFHDNLIVLGDLNTTSWSHAFQDFKDRMGLRDARLGYGLQLTWPSFFPVMGVTLDHVLVSPAAVVLDHRIGPDIGSDHFPVFVQVGWVN